MELIAVELFWIAVKWLSIAVAVSPIVIGIGWVLVEGSILPHLVPRAEIEAAADEVMQTHPTDPEGWAHMEEHAAWHRSQNFEQGKWRRVRMLIRKRLSAADRSPAA